MRVGVLTPQHRATDGGGYTLTDMIANAIDTFDFGAEVVMLDYDRLFSGRLEGEEEVHSYTSNGAYLLNTNLKASGIDLLWIIAPLGVIVEIDIPYIVTVWDLAHRYYPFFPEIAGDWTAKQRDTYYDRMLGSAAYVLVGTEVGRKEVSDFFNVPDRKIRTLPLPTAVVAPGEATSRQRPYLFYPAVFWAHKNHANTVLALAALRRNYGHDIDLVLAGSDGGVEDHVRSFVQANGLEDNVVFSGFVTRHELEKLYRGAEALLYLSLFGPDNLPPLEAFSCGCPVVASDHPGHREQLGGAAVFADPLDPEAIAKVVHGVLTRDAAQVEQFAARGKVIAEAHSIEAYLKAIRTLFGEFERLRRCWPASR